MKPKQDHCPSSIESLRLKARKYLSHSSPKLAFQYFLSCEIFYSSRVEKIGTSMRDHLKRLCAIFKSLARMSPSLSPVLLVPLFLSSSLPLPPSLSLSNPCRLDKFPRFHLFNQKTQSDQILNMIENFFSTSAEKREREKEIG